ncbi:TIR domain-containing protein [Gottfriedia sp. NPDC058432]|uniref:TIR domain-containing protein n=1 Tax=Gottfriedia sp. NPDC058432 TaxID=3346497 RepID=UPI00365D8271
MVYRNKTYICFDADTDMYYYRTLQMWNANSRFDFGFYNSHEINTIRPWSSEITIKQNLKERMKNSKLLIVLVGEKTKNLFKYVRWEIELAQEMGIPIAAVNLNKKNGLDYDRCPAILRDKTVVHVPFSEKAIKHVIDNWCGHYPVSKRDNKINLYYDFLG